MLEGTTPPSWAQAMASVHRDSLYWLGVNKLHAFEVLRYIET